MPGVYCPVSTGCGRLDAEEAGVIIDWIVEAPGHIQRIEQTGIPNPAVFVSHHDPRKLSAGVLAKGDDARAGSELVETFLEVIVKRRL